MKTRKKNVDVRLMSCVPEQLVGKTVSELEAVLHAGITNKTRGFLGVCTKSTATPPKKADQQWEQKRSEWPQPHDRGSADEANNNVPRPGTRTSMNIVGEE